MWDIFRPLVKEITTQELEVKGYIPPCLSGTLYRIGPNALYPSPHNSHFFDGHGMIHSISFREGKPVEYRNRWVQTQAYMTERQAGRFLFSGVGQPDLLGQFIRFARYFISSDSKDILRRWWQNHPRRISDFSPFANVANTNIEWHNGKLLALWDGGFPYEVTPELETIGKVDFGTKVPRHALGFCAHPKIDNDTGELLGIGTSLLPPYWFYYVINPDGSLARVCPIPIEQMSFIHDFAVTKNYAIAIDIPLSFSIVDIVKGVGTFRWNQERPTRIGYWSRKEHGEMSVRWIETEGFFFLHTAGAYEEADGTIVVLLCRYPSSPLGMSTCAAQKFRSSGEFQERGVLVKLKIDPQRGSVIQEQLDDWSVEFPALENQSLGAKANNIYFLATDSAFNFNAKVGIRKLDLERGTSSFWQPEPGQIPGEPIFIPATETSYRKGWIVTVVADRTLQQSRVVILDPESIESGPIGEVILPVMLPMTFHGLWLSEKSKAQ
ncbi:MAG: carotenoid oxygenase family protein [Cyanobacteria bacterium J06635_10]